MSVQIDQTLSAIELLANSGRSMSLAEITHALGMTKPGCHRLLNALVSRGFFIQDERSKDYSAALHIAILGLQFLSSSGLKDVYLPELRNLARKSNELVRLAVPQNDSLFFIAEAQGSTAGLRFDSNLGREAVLHATAAGKAWLSTMSDEDATRIVLKHGFQTVPTGPNAVNDIDALLRELRATRSANVAIAIEEAELGVTSMAVPIRVEGCAPSVAGCCIIVAPSVRMTEARLSELMPMLNETAHALSLLWPIRHDVSMTAPNQNQETFEDAV